MPGPDSEMGSTTTSASGSSNDHAFGEAEARSSLKAKLFSTLALVVAVGLVGLVEIALREHRNLAFESLKRDGVNFVTGVALSNPDVMLDGDDGDFHAVAAELMRRPDLQYIRFDSPGAADPMMATREGFSQPQFSEEAQRAEGPSSRLIFRDDALLLEVIVPLRSVVSTIQMKVDAEGRRIVPSSGSLSMTFDATQTQVALVAAAQRVRGAQAGVAVLILIWAWVAIRRALAPLELLANAAQRIGAGEERVEFPTATAKETHQLTLGLAAIQKQLKRSAGGIRLDRVRTSFRSESSKKNVDGASSIDPSARTPGTDGGRPTLADRTRSPRGAHHILLVEDNPVNRSVAVGMLESLDCTIVCADDGMASLAALDAESFDLVFMDIQMPRMDGHEATRRIRAEEERIGADPTPIVALTAHSQDEDRAASAEAGMNGHISKPFTRDDLRQAIQEWSTSKKYNERLDG